MDRHSRIVLIVIAAVTVVLVAVAIVVALQPTEELDPSTPEGTAQRFYQAVLDGDEDLAATYFAEDFTGDCPREDFEYYGPESFRVVIADTEISGDEAKVDVVITETWGEGPFRDSHTFDETLHMTRSGDGWLITRTPWPVEIYCP
ncbi:MAG: hypothetical protein ABFS21_10360 [Actinomycetota bacterium]